jgi:hypothetical protein
VIARLNREPAEQRNPEPSERTSAPRCETAVVLTLRKCTSQRIRTRDGAHRHDLQIYFLSALQLSTALSSSLQPSSAIEAP